MVESEIRHFQVQHTWRSNPTEIIFLSVFTSWNAQALWVGGQTCVQDAPSTLGS